MPEGEYAGAIINSNTAGAGGILVNFSGNGGLIFASPTSSYVAQTLQVNGGAVFVGTGDPAAAGQTGPFGSGAAALQIGTSATSGGANLGFMTYGANAGVGPAPTIITNRSLVVGGNGAPSTSVVLGGFTDDYTAINGSITLNGSATFTANGPAAGGRVDFNGTISGSGAVAVGNGSSTYVEGDSNANGIKGIQLTEQRGGGLRRREQLYGSHDHQQRRVVRQRVVECGERGFGAVGRDAGWQGHGQRRGDGPGGRHAGRGPDWAPAR